MTPPPLPPPLPHDPAPVAALSDVGALSAAPVLLVADDGWQDATPSPWRRYAARQVDVMLLGLLFWAAFGIVLAVASADLFDRFASSLLVENMIVSMIATNAIVVPFIAVLVGLLGSSPGKWLFGVRVIRRDGRHLGVADGLRRELAVWIKGFGMAVPLVSLFTLIASYRRLTEDGVTSWDDGEPWVVTHRPNGPLQVVLAIVGVAAIVGLRIVTMAL